MAPDSIQMTMFITVSIGLECFYPPRMVVYSRRQGAGARLSDYRGELRIELGVGRVLQAPEFPHCLPVDTAAHVVPCRAPPDRVAVHRLLEGSHAEPRIDDPANRRAAPDGCRGGSRIGGLLAGERRLLV